MYAYVVPKVYLVNLCEGTFLHRLTSADHIVTLADAIRVLARSVLNETVVLEVRRSHIVKDALKETTGASGCVCVCLESLPIKEGGRECVHCTMSQ